MSELNISHPMPLADMLERRFGVITGAARQMALEILGPAVAANDPVAIQSALNEIEARLSELATRDVQAMAQDVADRVSRRNRRLFTAGLAAAIGMRVLGDDDPATVPTAALPGVSGGLPVPGLAVPRRLRGVLVAKLSAQPQLLAHQFASRNAALIRSLTAEVVPALRDEVARAVQFGIPPDEAAARLMDKWRKSGAPIARGNFKPRVRNIVRDQVAKLNSDLTRARAQAAGLSRFTWTSRRDGNVRPLHRRIDGEVFEFAVGHPTEGLPGQPINCRCTAVPVVDAEEVMRAPGFIHLAESAEAFAIPA